MQPTILSSFVGLYCCAYRAAIAIAIAADHRIAMLVRDKRTPPHSPPRYVQRGGLARDWWVAVLIIPLTTACFAFANLRYSGPVILPDEIGYLAYGAVLAGYSVDAASSYHFGYSLFLAPLFWIFSSTEAIWRGVTVVNGLFFGGALAICFCLVRALFPRRPLHLAVLTIGLCAIYPAWLSISGYAFPQGCFAFFFVLSTWFLTKAHGSSTHAFGAVASASFLFWIHSLGIVCAALAVVMVWLMRRDLRLTCSAVAVAALLVVGYQAGLAPVVKSAMTPAELTPVEHYPSVSSAVDILTVSGIIEFCTRVLGQVTYLFVATLGIAVRPLLIALASILPLIRKRAALSSVQIASLFAVGSIAGMTIFSAAMFTVVESAVRQDHWVYGRYNEGAILPVLLIGLSTAPARVASSLVLLVPAIFAMLISILAPDALPLSVLNSAAFWPVVAFPDAGFSTQVVIGGVGAFLVTLAGSMGIAALALIVTFVICLPRQFEWHDLAARVQQKPPAVDLVRGLVAPGACVGFDAGFPMLHFLTFHLFDYRLSRMNPTRWKQECEGPFLSFDKGPDTADWVASGAGSIKVFGKGELPQDRYSGLAVSDSPACVRSWCYVADAEILSKRSQIGRLNGDALEATENGGFLFFGPYIDARKGRYHLDLRGENLTSTSRLEVIADRGAAVFASVESFTSSSRLQVEFELEYDVKGLEVRLLAPSASNILVRGYTLTAAR